MCTNVSAADFAVGAEAYDGGRYGDAFAEWHALARQGETRAQVAIAGMYRFGEGRPMDFAAAASWYERAARAGNPIAQLNYAELLETGRGVTRDRAGALKWYGRAAGQGNDWAAQQRDRLAAKPDHKFKKRRPRDSR
ncbi:MAG: TPR repeat protein [Paracoccaceae bacterium]|jgi:TPR repeat protein